MNETDLRKTMFDHFMTLNDFSGVEFLKENNVSFPNKEFTPPQNERWFELDFKCGEPSPVSICEDSQNRYNGFLQIGICTPLNVSTDEADDIYSFISKLFARGKFIGDDIEIENVFLATEGAEDICYKTVVRVMFSADIDC